MSAADLQTHLATGNTHICQCWALERRDGQVFGFTDHDLPLTFDGITFRADSGLAAKALSSANGLSVNNSEALGLLQADVITETDIRAGRYDWAKVTNWTVQWDNVAARRVNFVGHIGTITMRDGSFEAELRGLTDSLNQPQGRSYLRTCSSRLGDDKCQVDLASPTYQADLALTEIISDTTLSVPGTEHAQGWFTHGVATVLSGDAAGLMAAIKLDQSSPGARRVSLWQPLGIRPAPGDVIRLQAGCDGTAGTCSAKFGNLLNFSGFPHLPGDDWLANIPRSEDLHDGGSLFR